MYRRVDVAKVALTIELQLTGEGEGKANLLKLELIICYTRMTMSVHMYIQISGASGVVGFGSAGRSTGRTERRWLMLMKSDMTSCGDALALIPA